MVSFVPKPGHICSVSPSMKTSWRKSLVLGFSDNPICMSYVSHCPVGEWKGRLQGTLPWREGSKVWRASRRAIILQEEARDRRLLEGGEGERAASVTLSFGEEPWD